ncbi:MAG TPA: hypothetical protein VIC03_04130 [Gemmatimonadaceae bacterium]|jgi:hypothetical protein
MDRDVINFGGVMLICLCSLWALTAIGIRARHSLRRQKQPDALRPDAFDERFAQLQQSVDAIAVEVERIAEGQRFSSKLLADSSRNSAYSGDR